MTMKALLHKAVMPAALGLAMFLVPGCGDAGEEAPRTEGPIENTGEGIGQDIDRGLGNAERGLERTGNELGDVGERTAGEIREGTNEVGAEMREGGRALTGEEGARQPTATENRDNNVVPGLPSVQGTDTSNLSTADAAAQRLIDKVEVEMKKGDQDHVKRLISELQGMKDSLSAEYKQKVETLAKQAETMKPNTGTAAEQ